MVNRGVEKSYLRLWQQSSLDYLKHLRLCGLGGLEGPT